VKVCGKPRQEGSDGKSCFRIAGCAWNPKPVGLVGECSRLFATVILLTAPTVEGPDPPE
jgi:hypothetical protein